MMSSGIASQGVAVGDGRRLSREEGGGGGGGGGGGER